jgi:hypothetical protein
MPTPDAWAQTLFLIAALWLLAAWLLGGPKCK